MHSLNDTLRVHFRFWYTDIYELIYCTQNLKCPVESVLWEWCFMKHRESKMPSKSETLPWSKLQVVSHVTGCFAKHLPQMSLQKCTFKFEMSPQKLFLERHFSVQPIYFILKYDLLNLPNWGGSVICQPVAFHLRYLNLYLRFYSDSQIPYGIFFILHAFSLGSCFNVQNEWELYEIISHYGTI